MIKYINSDANEKARRGVRRFLAKPKIVYTKEWFFCNFYVTSKKPVR